MTWTVPDQARDWFPAGTCECGADLDGAADLGVARSYQQKEVPEPTAVTIQHRPARDTVPVREDSRAPRPPGVPDSAVSIGPRLCALAVYLLVFQHLPVERCRLLLSDVAGAEVSAGFIRSCLARAASMAAGVVKLIKTLIIASRVVGFDETTLRSGAAKNHVHGAFHREVLAVPPRHPVLDTMKDSDPGQLRRDRESPTGRDCFTTWKNICPPPGLCLPHTELLSSWVSAGFTSV